MGLLSLPCSARRRHMAMWLMLAKDEIDLNGDWSERKLIQYCYFNLETEWHSLYGYYRLGALQSQSQSRESDMVCSNCHLRLSSRQAGQVWVKSNPKLSVRVAFKKQVLSMLCAVSIERKLSWSQKAFNSAEGACAGRDGRAPSVCEDTAPAQHTLSPILRTPLSLLRLLRLRQHTPHCYHNSQTLLQSSHFTLPRDFQSLIPAFLAQHIVRILLWLFSVLLFVLEGLSTRFESHRS